MPAATSTASGSGAATPVSPASSAASASSGSAASQQPTNTHAHIVPHMPHALGGHDEDDDDDADDDGAATGAAGDKKRGHGASCHQCKTTKDPQYLFFCTNKAEKGVRKRRCRKKYCDSCLKRSYGNDLSDIIPSWQCPSCLGLCICAACHRKSTKRGAAPVAPSGSPSSIASGHSNEEVPAGSNEVEAAHQPASSPSSKRAVKSEKIKTESAASAGTPRQKKRAVAAHVQMAPEEDEQQQQQQQGGEYDHDSYNDPPSHQHAHAQAHGHHAPPASLYLNGIHHSSAQQQAAHSQLAFSLASPNPLSSSHHLMLTPNAAAHAMLTPNGTNYNLSTYPSLDNGNLDLESMTSAGSYRTGSASVGGSGSAMQTPMPGGAINAMMQFSPNPAYGGAPLMQYASSSVDAQLAQVQQQIQYQQAILAQHQQAQGSYPFTPLAASTSPSFAVPQPARGTSFVVDTEDEQSTAGGAGATVGGTEYTGEGGDNESEYSSSYQSNRNPTMHASGLTVEQMQALRLQQQHAQLQSISPDVTASQSNLMRQAGLDQRRAMEEGVGGAPAGSMSVPSKTRSISGGRSNAADRLSISPLTISRGMSGEDRPAGMGVERLSLGSAGADSNRNSPRFSSRSLSGRGNSSTAAGSDPIVSGEDGLSASQLAELEPLMSGMNAAQRQSFLAEAKALNSHAAATNPNANGISSNIPSPHSGSPRSAKRKIAAAASAAPSNGGAAQAPAVDLSCPNQHVKYQMVARLKSQMNEGHSGGGGSGSGTGTATGTGNATGNSTGSSPVLNSPADDEVIARTKLLQNEQKQMRLQHAMDEERRRLASLSGQNKRHSGSSSASPSQAHRELNINVKAEHAHQPQQQHPSASPPNGLPPSHNTPTSGTRRAQQNNKQLPSPLTHLTNSNSPPPVVPQQPHQQFNNAGPLLFSPVPVFQSHSGGGGNSHNNSSLAAGAQSPSTMLNLVDSSVSSAGSSGSGATGMFSPPAPMFASSQHSMLPGQNSYALQGAQAGQPDYLQWGSAHSGSGGHAAALNMLSPLPGQLHLNYPGSSTPGLSSSGAGHNALFSPNPLMLGSSAHANYPSHHASQGGAGLFSPDPYASSSAGQSNLHYPAPLVPVLPSSHDSGLGDSLSYRQLSAGGQNLQMGGLDDSADFMRQSSANLGMVPAPSNS